MERHLVGIKGKIQQEKITILNIYIWNRGPNFTKETLLDLKSQIDPNTLMVGDFSTWHPPADRLSRQK